MNKKNKLFMDNTFTGGGNPTKKDLIDYQIRSLINKFYPHTYTAAHKPYSNHDAIKCALKCADLLRKNAAGHNVKTFSNLFVSDFDYWNQVYKKLVEINNNLISVTEGIFKPCPKCEKLDRPLWACDDCNGIGYIEDTPCECDHRTNGSEQRFCDGNCLYH